MQVHFFIFGKDKDSTRIPGEDSLFGVYNGTMKEPSSLLTPVIAFDLSEVPQANYFYIPEFSRYYFCRQWSYSRGMWIADMEVDVLATYRDFIGATSAYILRSSSAYDGNIIDTTYPTKAGWSTLMDIGVTPFTAKGYILQIASNDGVQIYWLDQANFDQLCRDIWFEWGQIEGMTEVLQNVTDPMQYIQSVQTTSGGLDFWHTNDTGLGVTIKCGLLPTNARGYRLIGTGSATIGLSVQKHPEASDRPYLKSEPYSIYSMFVPGCGYFTVPSNSLYNADAVSVSITGDAYTGKIRARVSTTDNAAIMDVMGNINNSWAIGSSYVQVSSAVSSTAGIIGDALSFHWGDALRGVVSAGEALLPTVTTNGTLSGGIGLNEDPVLLLRFQPITQEDITHKGRPLLQIKTINTLSGYLLCENAHAEFPATSEELREIEQYMNGGFFYE